MCQGWVNIAGLTGDVIGFILIAWEWHVMFRRHISQKISEIDAHYRRIREKQEGIEPEDDGFEDNWSAGKHMYMGLMEDVRYRGKFVYTGSGLIIAGFVGQVFGSWPGGISWLYVLACN